MEEAHRSIIQDTEERKPMHDYRSRIFEILKEMLDRAHGRAKQSVDHTTKGEGLNFSFNALSVQEKEVMLELIEKSKNGA